METNSLDPSALTFTQKKTLFLTISSTEQSTPQSGRLHNNFSAPSFVHRLEHHYPKLLTTSVSVRAKLAPTMLFGDATAAGNSSTAAISRLSRHLSNKLILEAATQTDSFSPAANYSPSVPQSPDAVALLWLPESTADMSPTQQQPFPTSIPSSNIIKHSDLHTDCTTAISQLQLVADLLSQLVDDSQTQGMQVDPRIIQALKAAQGCLGSLDIYTGGTETTGARSNHNQQPKLGVHGLATPSSPSSSSSLSSHLDDAQTAWERSSHCAESLACGNCCTGREAAMSQRAAPLPPSLSLYQQHLVQQLSQQQLQTQQEEEEKRHNTESPLQPLFRDDGSWCGDGGVSSPGCEAGGEVEREVCGECGQGASSYRRLQEEVQGLRLQLQRRAMAQYEANRTSAMALSRSLRHLDEATAAIQTTQQPASTGPPLAAAAAAGCTDYDASTYGTEICLSSAASSSTSTRVRHETAAAASPAVSPHSHYHYSQLLLQQLMSEQRQTTELVTKQCARVQEQCDNLRMCVALPSSAVGSPFLPRMPPAEVPLAAVEVLPEPPHPTPPASRSSLLPPRSERLRVRLLLLPAEEPSYIPSFVRNQGQDPGVRVLEKERSSHGGNDESGEVLIGLEAWEPPVRVKLVLRVLGGGSHSRVGSRAAQQGGDVPLQPLPLLLPNSHNATPMPLAVAEVLDGESNVGLQQKPSLEKIEEGTGEGECDGGDCGGGLAAAVQRLLAAVEEHTSVTATASAPSAASLAMVPLSVLDGLRGLLWQLRSVREGWDPATTAGGGQGLQTSVATSWDVGAGTHPSSDLRLPQQHQQHPQGLPLGPGNSRAGCADSDPYTVTPYDAASECGYGSDIAVVSSDMGPHIQVQMQQLKGLDGSAPPPRNPTETRGTDPPPQDDPQQHLQPCQLQQQQQWQLHQENCCQQEQQHNQQEHVEREGEGDVGGGDGRSPPSDVKWLMKVAERGPTPPCRRSTAPCTLTGSLDDQDLTDVDLDVGGSHLGSCSKSGLVAGGGCVTPRHPDSSSNECGFYREYDVCLGDDLYGVDGLDLDWDLVDVEWEELVALAATEPGALLAAVEFIWNLLQQAHMEIFSLTTQLAVMSHRHESMRIRTREHDAALQQLAINEGEALLEARRLRGQLVAERRAMARAHCEDQEPSDMLLSGLGPRVHLGVLGGNPIAGSRGPAGVVRGSTYKASGLGTVPASGDSLQPQPAQRLLQPQQHPYTPHQQGCDAQLQEQHHQVQRKAILHRHRSVPHQRPFSARGGVAGGGAPPQGMGGWQLGVGAGLGADWGR